MARTKGTKQLGVEVSESVVDEFRAFCESREETLRYHVEMALRRHMANPPEKQPAPSLPPAPPLPPLPAASMEPAPKKKPKGKK